MKVSAQLIVIAIVLSQFANCNTPNPGFCDSFQNDDQNLKLLVDNYLNELESYENKSIRFEMLRKWLKKKDCVTEVKVMEGYIRTSPPLKKIIIKARFRNKTISKTIQLSVEPERLSMEKIIL